MNAEIYLRENFVKKVAKLLFMNKMKGNLKKAAELVDDKTFQAQLDAIKHNYIQLDKQLDFVCKRNPSLHICKDHKAGTGMKW